MMKLLYKVSQLDIVKYENKNKTNDIYIINMDSSSGRDVDVNVRTDLWRVLPGCVLGRNGVDADHT